jgi:Pyridine nucleotide-disulphide oxidoreductase
MNEQDNQRRVVIIGGGFAGLFAARALRRAPVRVTLIDSRQHHLFQPLLYQCSTGILSEGKIAIPLRDLLRKHKNTDFVMADVTGIDAEGRRVLATRPLGDQLEFGYDYLIVAAGVEQSYFGHDEYAKWAPGMKTIEDALIIRRRVFGAFAAGSRSPWSVPDPPASNWPGRSARWPPRRCATNTVTSSPRTPGYCFSTAGTPRSPRSARPFRPRRHAPSASSASSSTCTRS